MGRPNLSLHPCVRCGRGSDMACPITDPLEELLAALEAEGYKPCFDEIDARVARDAMSACTNCGARGRFAYVGMSRPQSVPSGCDFGRQEASYRAFWVCERCSHWVEV